MSFKPRYILAEEAEERIIALYRKERGDAAEIFNTAIDACQSIILDMYDNSSEDTVPVVRCKDCKWATNEPYRGDDIWICNFNPWRRSQGKRKPDFFCADGERSEDATN